MNMNLAQRQVRSECGPQRSLHLEGPFEILTGLKVDIYLHIIKMPPPFTPFHERSRFKATERTSHGAFLAPRSPTRSALNYCVSENRYFCDFLAFERSVVFLGLQQVLRSSPQTRLLQGDWLLSLAVCFILAQCTHHTKGVESRPLKKQGQSSIQVSLAGHLPILARECE